MERESLRLLLSQGCSVEKIAERFGKHPSTVSYRMHKYGLEAVNRDKHAAKGGIDQERLRSLVVHGLGITELAAEAVQAAVTASTAGAQRLVLNCRVHGDTDFVREGSGYFRCTRCRSAAVMRHRRRLKEQLIAEAGGRCVLCGYDRRPRALEFHHVDPRLKRFALSRKGITLSLEALRAEARKCVLLCSNCHAEVEDGSIALPDTVPRTAA